jgi:hypothetical protein
MGTEQLEYAYAGDILKWDDNGDGTINVYGVATDPGVDLDGQNCDPTWLRKAMPEWFKFANVREQHSSVAAGVGLELTHADGDQWMLKSHIVDPGTVLKVKNKVLKGYSIGVRKGKVQRGKSIGAPNGTIVGGDIVEVSLVDRPCNPRATISIAKALGDSTQLEAVEPLLIDIDPAVYGEDDVPSADDVDGEPDGEQDSQTVDEPVDGDDDPDDELTLFDDLDDGEGDDSDDVDAEVAKAMGLAARDGEVTITKGLLEQLIHGPKDPKRGKGGRFAGSNKKPGADAPAARKRREAEAERERRHRGAMDAEALQDANNAQRQGRRQEADEHRGRLGAYRKALSVREYREGVRLVADVLDGKIVKGLDLDDMNDVEIMAELCDFASVEADQLAAGGYVDPEDVSVLLDTCAAIAKMAGVEPSFLRPEGGAVDESTAAATLDVAEIVKAQVAEQLSEIQKAHEAEIANLRAQVTKMAATPLPGGPVINKSVMPSAPAASANAKAAYYAEQARTPGLRPELAAAYAQLAEAERARG